MTNDEFWKSLSHRGVGLYALWAGGRGVGDTTNTSPLPARRLHRLTGRLPARRA